MRRMARVTAEVGPEQRLARAIALAPPAAQAALAAVADREDLPLVAGSWAEGEAGCLVANVLRVAGAQRTDGAVTLDLRILGLFPELSSRDLNRLIVAWDEAAAQDGRGSDPALRRLLRNALARAGVGYSSRSASVTPTSACSPSRT